MMKKIGKEEQERRENELKEEFPELRFSQGFMDWYNSLPGDDEDEEEEELEYESKEFKPWDTMVRFAPESEIDEGSEDWYFQLNDKEAVLSRTGEGKPVKCLVQLSIFAPGDVVIYSDELYEKYKGRPEINESVEGFPMMFGMSSDGKITIEIE